MRFIGRKQFLRSGRFKIWLTALLICLGTAFYLSASYQNAARQRIVEQLKQKGYEVFDASAQNFLDRGFKAIYAYYYLGEAFPNPDFQITAPAGITAETLRQDAELINQLQTSVGFAVKESKHLTDLNWLEEFEVLQEIGISDCPELADLSGLQHLPDCKIIMLSNCDQITDFTPIGKLPDLKCLWLSNLDQLKDVDFARNLTQLKIITIEQCPNLQNITGFDNLPEVAVKNLSGNSQLDSGTSEQE